jgi:sugar lactone lactonase YvrE
MITRTLKKIGPLALFAAMGLGWIVSGCGTDNGTSGSGSGGSDSSSSSSSSSTSSSSASSSGSTGTGGGLSAAPTFVTHFDPAKGEQPEGLYTVGNKAYVGWAGLGKIETVDLLDGTVKDFGSIPAPPMNGGFLLGIVADASSAAYVAFGGGPGMVVKNGIYKLPPTGGAVKAPWASDPAMNFPNGLIFDPQNNLFASDSGGFIFKITSTGTVSKWLADPLLVASGKCAFAAPFPVGANGIVRTSNAFYVANTNVGQIVKVPISADGSAGTPSIFAGPDCDALGGIDGISLDTDGSILAVLNTQNKLIRVDTAGKVSTVVAGMPLDNPATTSIATVGGKKSVYITNSAFFSKTPAPGLLAYPLP